MNKCKGCNHYVIKDSRSNWNGEPPTYIYGCELNECKKSDFKEKARLAEKESDFLETGITQGIV